MNQHKFDDTLNVPTKNNAFANSMDGKSPLGRSIRGLSPSLRKQGSHAGSPNMGMSPGKSRTVKSPSKTEEEKGMTSPTSISMQNSFIIKNADESFD